MNGSSSLLDPITLGAFAGIILLSFLSEDAATLSSALLVFGGPIAWPIGFVACFIGIWVGDLGLYSIARCIGRPILSSQWLSRFTDQTAIRRCEKRFSSGGSLTLLASRFVPGTRLPTYLAAGLFSMPAMRFALVTGFSVLVWMVAIFAFTRMLGSQALAWFAFLQGRIAAVIFTGFAIAIVLFLFKKLAVVAGGADPGSLVSCETRGCCAGRGRGQRPRLQLLPANIRRWRHWEFWPAWLFYIPVVAHYSWLAFRYRSFTLPTAANPGMPTGGFVGESKLEIIKQLQDADAALVADAYLLEGWTISDRLLSLHQLCRRHGITLPFILKPDLGQRGNGVRLVKSWRAALDYLLDMDAPVILQRYAPGRYEAGIFYFRFPGEPRGRIFSITEKIFPTITGDGAHTIEQLIRADSRASIIAQTYLRRFAHRRNEILPAGEVFRLVESGNHAQGCIFRDGGYLWTAALERAIDDISQKLPDFYVGRYDIRYDDEEEFRAGRNFQIVELNGASSEATSIYDSRTSLRSAYRTLFRQWKLVFAIGAANRARGWAPSPLLTLWREWRHYSVTALSYPCAS